MRAVFAGERFSWRMQVNISIRYVNNKISMFNINARTLFAEISKKNLDTDLKIIMVDHQNNYVKYSNMMKV